MPSHLVQLIHPDTGRAVAMVEEPALILLKDTESIYGLARDAILLGKPITKVLEDLRTAESLPYDEVYNGQSEWQLLPAFDHPADPFHCFVTGTGLTHKASAENREKMHQAAAAGNETDSMRMYAWGVEGGSPPKGKLGVQPEWFYKGTGTVLKAHGQPLEQPNFADDAGEEPEVAAAYIIDDHGRPWRIGLASGNEFADHVMERKNYLYLAHSKLRQCAIGPELVLDHDFRDLSGEVKIIRNGEALWSHAIQSGEVHMCHSLANLEYHQFKYPQHRIPWQAHIHFFGAAAFSFGAEIRLEQGDIMEIAWEGLGRPLRNAFQIDPHEEVPINVFALASS